MEQRKLVVSHTHSTCFDLISTHILTCKLQLPLRRKRKKKSMIIFLKNCVDNLIVSHFSCNHKIASQVLGIPWEVDTEGLREYMSKFGELEDCIVMKVSLLLFVFSLISLVCCYYMSDV